MLKGSIEYSDKNLNCSLISYYKTPAPVKIAGAGI